MKMEYRAFRRLFVKHAAFFSSGTPFSLEVSLTSSLKDFSSFKFSPKKSSSQPTWRITYCWQCKNHWITNHEPSHEEPWDKKWVRFWGRRCTELMPCSGVALYSAWSCPPSQCPVPSYHFKAWSIRNVNSILWYGYQTLFVGHSTFHVFSTFSRIIFSLWPTAVMSDLGQNWPWANNAIISGQYKSFFRNKLSSQVCLLMYVDIKSLEVVPTKVLVSQKHWQGNLTNCVFGSWF